MSQKTRALKRFQKKQQNKRNRGMTPLDMWVELGIYRAADVVFQLRKDGHDIRTDYVIVKNQYDEYCRVAYYTLED